MFGVVENGRALVLGHLQFSYTNIHLIPKGCNLWSFSFPLFTGSITHCCFPFFLDSITTYFTILVEYPFSRLYFQHVDFLSNFLPLLPPSSYQDQVLVLPHLERTTATSLSRTQRHKGRAHTLDSHSRNLGQLSNKGYHVTSGEIPTQVKENGLSSQPCCFCIPQISPEISTNQIARRHLQITYQTPPGKAYQTLLLSNFHVHGSSQKISISSGAIHLHFFDSKTPLNLECIVPITTPPKKSTDKFLLTS